MRRRVDVRAGPTRWELERDEAAWNRDPSELRDIAGSQRPRHVLQADVRKSQVEGRVRELTEVDGIVDEQADVRGARDDDAAAFDHRRRNIDAGDGVRPASPCEGQPPDTATEVEHRAEAACVPGITQESVVPGDVCLSPVRETPRGPSDLAGGPSR